LNRHYVECACESTEHTLRFTYDAEDNEVYTEVQLARWHPWYRRVWLALKYVFVYQCKYGHWDCTIIDKSNASALIAVLEQIKQET
jgi:hypothetical protein